MDGIRPDIPGTVRTVFPSNPKFDWRPSPPILFSGSIAFFLLAGFLLADSDRLPSKAAIDPRVTRGAPEQTPITDPKKYTREYGDLSYEIIPRATYRLPGLVVSLHHSSDFTDISHKSDPANTMDVCVVWGPNVTTGGYRQVSYDHGDFTCYWKWTTEHDPPFSDKFIANNHLIPDDGLVADQIDSLKVGDQIIIEGTLVDYVVSGESGTLFSRHTSLTRDDTGSGACEIVLATSVEVIRRNRPLAAPLATVFGIVGSLLFFLALMFAGKTRLVPHSPRVLDLPHDPRDPLDPRNFIAREHTPAPPVEMPPPTRRENIP